FRLESAIPSGGDDEIFDEIGSHSVRIQCLGHLIEFSSILVGNCSEAVVDETSNCLPWFLHEPIGVDVIRPGDPEEQSRAKVQWIHGSEIRVAGHRTESGSEFLCYAHQRQGLGSRKQAHEPFTRPRLELPDPLSCDTEAMA